MQNWLYLNTKNLIKRIKSLFDWDPWANRSWSQEGEDRILERIYEKKTSGFYVDVGAHHPKRFSNTYLFYVRGWRGINIDAMPGTRKLFDSLRPRDINIEAGVGANDGILKYYIFSEPALNGFSEDISINVYGNLNQYQLKSSINVNVYTLSSLLDSNLPNGQKIDFMSVDVEGLDFDVLGSNNWEKYRPTFVLAEIIDCPFKNVENTDVGKLMSEVGYELHAKCVNTVIFKDLKQ